MLDDVFNIIYSWGHRYIAEIGVTIVCFLLIHFVGYPFIIRRHDAQAPQQNPSIKTGDVTTKGSNSPVTIGAEPHNSGTDKNVQPQK
jgi:hypothetical protein